MTDLLVLLGLGLANLLLAMLALIVVGPSPLYMLMALVAVAASAFAGSRIAHVRLARRAAAVSQAPRYPLRAIDQTEYAAVLTADALHRLRFTMSPNRLKARCLRCHREAAVVTVNHPVWDGPFDEGGSGVVDRRVVYWCRTCDGPLSPSTDGAAIRLPYLDNLPIKLLPELYERPVFHRLPFPVERYVPPPPAPAEGAASDKETPS